jgi:hypothetical protein
VIRRQARLYEYATVPSSRAVFAVAARGCNPRRSSRAVYETLGGMAPGGAPPVGALLGLLRRTIANSATEEAVRGSPRVR